MSLVQLNRIGIGEVSILPGTVKMISTDGLSTITTAGYLKNSSSSASLSIGLAPSDVIECLYSYNLVTGIGILAYLQPTILNGLITLNLWVNPSAISLPVTGGNLASFIGTTGKLQDSEIPSNTVSTYTGPTSPGSVAIFSNTTGNLEDANYVQNVISSTQAGGSATVSVVAPNATSTSIAFAAIKSSANAVTIEKVTPGTATVTILCSGDPGASVFVVSLYTNSF